MPFFYSLDYNAVHIVSFGTEDNPINAYEMANSVIRTVDDMDENSTLRFEQHYGPNSEQYKWLENDLQKAKRVLSSVAAPHPCPPLTHSLLSHRSQRQPSERALDRRLHAPPLLPHLAASPELPGWRGLVRVRGAQPVLETL